MDLQTVAHLLTLLLTTSNVLSFTISTTKDQTTDLAEALASVQGQRERAEARYPSSGKVLDDRQQNLQVVLDWLRKSDVDVGGSYSGLQPSLVFDSQTKASKPQVRYDFQSANRPLISRPVEPTRQELNDIFDTSDVDESKSRSNQISEAAPRKNIKADITDIKGVNVVHKKSTYSSQSKVGFPTNTDIPLNTLTKEELNALAKAINTLRKQSIKLGQQMTKTVDGKDIMMKTKKTEEKTKSLTIAQPVNIEKPQSSDGALEQSFTKEMKGLLQKSSDSSDEIDNHVASNNVLPEIKTTQKTELDLIKDLVSNLQDNFYEEAEQELTKALQANAEAAKGGLSTFTKETDWHGHKQYRKNHSLKRNNKRSVTMVPELIKDLIADEDSNYNDEERDDAVDNLDNELKLPSREMFAAKILKLQNEVSRLKVISLLEHLETHVLTDALNEASLGQDEGTVSDMEFESLQQAIQLQEAVQDIETVKDGSRDVTGAIKREEPGHTQHDEDLDSHSEDFIRDSLPFYTLPPHPSEGRRVTKDDIQRLLGQTYLMKDQAARKSDTSLASLLISRGVDCPATHDDSIVCELNDLYAVPEDDKTRSLCGSQMCCGCGDSVDVGKDKCGLVYEATRSAVCQGKEICSMESETLPRTIKLADQYMLQLFSRVGAHGQNSFWACYKRQQSAFALDVWVCGYCRSFQSPREN